VKDNPGEFVLSKWDELYYKARSVTNMTSKAIRNKSSIPYEYTVPREFAERDFDYFYNKDFCFTAFVSQPGCGKSILLTHLIDKSFFSEHALYKNDMVWFIDANTLYHSEYSDFDLENWLNEQLGGGKNFINYFNDDPLRRKGKVILVLDGFDEVSIKKAQLKSLLNRIANFICASEGCDWIKVVLSMRSTTWIDFYEQIRHSAYLKSKLFIGNQVMMDYFANVPPLSDKEINQVLSKFSDIDVTQVNQKLKSQFKYPFYLQVYYQLKEDGKTFDYRTDLPFYELISGFVSEKINLSQHYTEKILLLKKIIVLSKQIKKGNLVYKENLLNDITVFREAYEQLLIDGILIEEKLADHIMPKEVVRFIHSDIYEYFLFIQIIDNNQRNINNDLFEYLRIEYSRNPLRLQLLQWAVRHAVINNNITPVIEALKLKLPSKEKNKLMLFILQLLEFKSLNKNKGFNRIIDEHLHDAFLKEIMQLDLLGPCYKEILKTLKRLTTQPNELMIYSSLLAYIAVLELDTQQLRLEIADLKNIGGGLQKWLVKPADAFSIIYN
ncbi:MAG: NACHT domain-containing protein, partial [Pedobacter sp.]